MNNEVRKTKKAFDKRVKDFLLLAILAMLLLFVVWKVFQDEPSKQTYTQTHSETELRIIRLLEELDGVGEAEVIVYEEDNRVESVVVLCDGAKDLNVVINVREAVAAALGTNEKSIKIYLKKE